MITLRLARWPDDRRLLAGLDASFTTDRVYDVVREPLGFALVERRVDPPLRKDYGPITGLDPASPELECAVVAEAEGQAVGFAAAQYEAWSRRMSLWHIYVAPRCRGQGVGKALIQEIETLARSAGARCLRTETQNTNYPAIQFYQQVGFRLCGLDLSLYDPATAGPDEVAVFLARELNGSGPV